MLEIGLECMAENGASRMPDLVLRAGSKSAQGVRSNNEDNLVVDQDHHLYVVADGMGGQERGEIASSMAVEMLPRVVQTLLAVNEPPEAALIQALLETNQAIVEAGRTQPEGRRMGTTAVVALHLAGKVYITHLGDSRAYLLRSYDIRQLTVDHSVAQALVGTGALTALEARCSPYQHILHKFLGCADLGAGLEVSSFTPQAGDRLLLATDGLTNHIADDELRIGPKLYPDPQVWIDYLVDKALENGSRDNVTGIVVAFEAA
jgi:protein phosphatase